LREDRGIIRLGENPIDADLVLDGSLGGDQPVAVRFEESELQQNADSPQCAR
jgi:hypothetical protein